MKKVLSLLMVAGMLSFFACGPSAEEKAAKEKATQDSIARVQKTADSLKEVAVKDSLDKAAKAKAEADSIAKVEADKKNVKPASKGNAAPAAKPAFNKSGARK